ncbi:unnamed protein product, partial [marine sediment metagenome]
DGKPLTKLPTPRLTLENFLRALRRVKPGQTITLTIRRKGKESNYQIVTEPAPLQPFEAPRYYNKDLGLAVRDLVMLDKQGLPGRPPPSSGGIVFMVIPKLPAAGRLIAGDVVTMINNKAVQSVEAIKVVLDPISRPGALMPIDFLVLRNGNYQKVTVTPPPQRRPG